MSEKRVIQTDRLMRPIAHFSHAVRTGDLLHVGAAAGTDDQRRLAGATPGALDPVAQAAATFDNLETVLQLLDASPDDLCRVKLYVADPRDIAACVDVFERRYGAIGLRPVLVGSHCFPLPQAALELDAVALAGSRPATRVVPGAVARGNAARCFVVAHAPEAADGAVPADASAQTTAMAAALQSAIEAAGMTIRDIVNLQVTIPDLRDLPAVERVLGTVLRAPYPACSLVQAPLGQPALKVQVEATCLAGGGLPLTAPDCVTALACASPAMLAGDELYIGAQNGIAEGIPAADVEAQTRRAFARIGALLTAAGMTTDCVLRTNNVLVDWRDYGAFNRGYGASVTPPYPPRTTAHGGLADPAARVQIEGSAYRHPGRFVVLDRSV
ncbi:MAG: Rid family hydrolase [Lautropia sp.]